MKSGVMHELAVSLGVLMTCSFRVVCRRLQLPDRGGTEVENPLAERRLGVERDGRVHASWEA